MKFRKKIIGLNRIDSQNRGIITNRAIRILFRVAKDLGKISPKIKIRKVMMPVAIPTALLDTILRVIAVASAEAPTLTILLPMRIVDSKRWGSSFIFLMRVFVSPLSLARCIAFALLMENRAVSAEEKNPERKSKTTKTTI